MKIDFVNWSYLFLWNTFLVVFTMQPQHVLIVVGTRPDCIKMAPVYRACKQHGITVKLCSTDQHKDLLDDIFSLFSINPDIRLRIGKEQQDLLYVTTAILEQCKQLFTREKPQLVVVQGDTTTAMAAALAAFYCQIPIAHVEAGLRTKKLYEPFPEEMNRRFIAQVASYHFAPTYQAVLNLTAEGVVPEKIFYTGNTIVDALQYMLQRLHDGTVNPSRWLKNIVDQARDQRHCIVSLTMHRREAIPHGVEAVFNTIKNALLMYPHLCVVYPAHPNPAIQHLIQKNNLAHTERLLVTQPLSYIDMVYLLQHSAVVITDSGGLQEEGISLHKKVLVLRHETERLEGLEHGNAILVGYNEDAILKELGNTYLPIPISVNPYGDGTASEKIASLINHHITITNLNN